MVRFKKGVCILYKEKEDFMESSFIKELKQRSTETQTQNGDKAYNTTKSCCLDLFASAGVLRGSEERTILSYWEKAYKEDPILAVEILFYIRSVREGYGERRVFRVIWNSLDKLLQETLWNLVPVVGRWDDLEETILNNFVIGEDIYSQLLTDYEKAQKGGEVTLLAKWLPCGRGNKGAKKRTKKMAQRFNLKEQDYRAIVTSIRKRLNLVESKMAKKEWREVDYSLIPSRAGFVHSKAFLRNDPERYTAFMLSRDTNKNMSNLTPTEILSKYGTIRVDNDLAEIYSVMWNNLPDYLDGSSAIAVMDLSASMTWSNLYKSSVEPLDASLAMGIYFSERNKGAFKNLAISFSTTPRVYSFNEGDTIWQKRAFVLNNDSTGGSTNLRAVFSLLLDVAIKNNSPQEDLPKSIFIFSDMQFDKGVDTNSSTFEDAKAEYERAGYKLPRVVFWNLAADPNTYPVQSGEKGTVLVSGYSTKLFTSILKGDYEYSPEEQMKETIREFSCCEEITKRLQDLSL